MFRVLYFALGAVGLLGVVYALGPVPHYERQPGLPAVPSFAGPAATAEFAADLERREDDAVRSGDVRPQARAHIVWGGDTAFAKTETAFVYLHGFSASPPEGSPLVDELARRYGANVYFPRLSDHGLTSRETYAEANPHRWRAEAKAAVAEARRYLGDSIILVGTSTGATLALDYAARFPERVSGLVLYSPNVALANGAATLLNGPWGLRLARGLSGGDYRALTGIPEECGYIWTLEYRVEGIVALQELLEETMTEQTFAQVTAPVMAAWYYRDEEHRDDIISTEAVEEMFGQLGTAPSRKRAHPLSEVSGHVITTECRTTGLDRVRAVTHDFLEEVVGLAPNQPAAAEVD